MLKWKQYSQKSVKNGSKTILSFSHLMEIRWPLPQNTWSMIPEVATIRVNTRNFILIVVNFVVTIIINIFTFREIGEACGIMLEIKCSLYLYFVIQRNLCKMKFLRFHFQGIYIYKLQSKFTQLSLDQRMNSIMENCNTFTLLHPRTEEKKIGNFSQ